MIPNIDSMNAISILQPNVFAELLDIESEAEKVEVEDLLIARAQELGVKTAFKRRLAAYKKDNAKINPFRCDFPLTLNDKGNPVASIDNFLQILRHDINYSGTLFLNELTWAPEKHVYGVRSKWSNEDDAELRRYIEKNYKIHNEKKLDDALRIVFAENKYHPVRDLIEKTKWDGTPRIKGLLCKWLGVDDEPYSHEISRLIFAGGIHRLYNPGCKFDDMPVLIGKNQGEGKSTFVRWLALDDEFFREVTEIEGQKGMEALEGVWICEMGELLALNRAKDVEAVKSYITRLVDVHRKPFDKRVSEHKRQCIFIGTTNRAEFLTDKTGNRRYYPVTCNSVGYELFKHEKEVKADILQCWAEAKYLYDLGEIAPYADQKLIEVIKERQQEAVEDDYRVGMIKAYLEDKEIVCAIELWQRAIGEFGKPDRRSSNEISIIMQGFPEWEKSRTATRIGNYGAQKCWFKNKQLKIKEPK